MRICRGLVLTMAALAVSAAGRQPVSGDTPSTVAAEWHRKVDPWVLSSAAARETEFLVFLSEQADLGGAGRLLAKEARGRFVFDRLTAPAERTQGPVLELLEARGAEHQRFWVANMIKVRGDLGLVEELALRDDVARVHANPAVRLQQPISDTESPAPDAVEPGVLKVRAPEVWAAGFTGQTVVIGGQDSGYSWMHPALKQKYRGYFSPIGTDHNYNWHDAIHTGGGTCGPDSPVPCDDSGHGTHTMGTMVGDDGAGNQVGVAPGARWIGCRSMDQGNGTPATYAECFQWFIAPTNLANQNPDPAKAPHVINNSWSCPPSAGCTDPNVLRTVVENTRAAGIMVVVSAGDSGRRCGTVNAPAAIYQSSFSVGATSVDDGIASFSSRGAVTVDGSNRLKPNVTAPGVGVRSSAPDGGYATLSGTGMAAPHVAGAVALLLSAAPALKGQVGVLEETLQDTAVGLLSLQTCGGIPGGQIPNNTFGHGRIDAFEAVRSQTADLTVTSSPWPRRMRTGRSLHFTLTVSNNGPQAAEWVSTRQNIPFMFFPGYTFVTSSQGFCDQDGYNIFCNLGTVPMGSSATIDVTARATFVGTGTSQVEVWSSRPDLNRSNNSLTFQLRTVDCPPLGFCP